MRSEECRTSFVVAAFTPVKPSLNAANFFAEALRWNSLLSLSARAAAAAMRSSIWISELEECSTRWTTLVLFTMADYGEPGCRHCFYHTTDEGHFLEPAFKTSRQAGGAAGAGKVRPRRTAA